MINVLNMRGLGSLLLCFPSDDSQLSTLPQLSGDSYPHLLAAAERRCVCVCVHVFCYLLYM